jgi:hypothetical protein
MQFNPDLTERLQPFAPGCDKMSPLTMLGGGPSTIPKSEPVFGKDHAQTEGFFMPHSSAMRVALTSVICIA